MAVTFNETLNQWVDENGQPVWTASYKVNGKIVNYVADVNAYPEIRRYLSELAGGFPAVNEDGSALVKYQILIVLDGDDDYSWNGSAWVVI